MVELTDKDIEKFKKLCEKRGIQYETEAELREAAYNLVRFAELAYDVAREEWQRKKRLEKEPKGFAFEGKGRFCGLCGNCVIEDMWYDKWGMKCIDCQKALEKKIVPGYVFKDRDKHRHVKLFDITHETGLKTPTIYKLIRQGKLKARIIPHEKYISTFIFLRSDNPNLASVLKAETGAQSKKRSAAN
jgi:hypothetical protein